MSQGLNTQTEQWRERDPNEALVSAARAGAYLTEGGAKRHGNGAQGENHRYRARGGPGNHREGGERDRRNWRVRE